MGSVSAMESIQRVLDAHGDELTAERLEGWRRLVSRIGGEPDLARVTIQGELYGASVFYEYGSNSDGGGVAGVPFDIDELAERFPDCDVAY